MTTLKQSENKELSRMTLADRMPRHTVRSRSSASHAQTSDQELQQIALFEHKLEEGSDKMITNLSHLTCWDRRLGPPAL